MQPAGKDSWRFDGTEVEQITDIVPGPNSSEPSNLTVFGDALYFSAYFDDVFDWRTIGDARIAGESFGVLPSQGSQQALGAVGWRGDGLALAGDGQLAE